MYYALSDYSFSDLSPLSYLLPLSSHFHQQPAFAHLLKAQLHLQSVGNATQNEDFPVPSRLRFAIDDVIDGCPFVVVAVAAEYILIEIVNASFPNGHPPGVTLLSRK